MAKQNKSQKDGERQRKKTPKKQPIQNDIAEMDIQRVDDKAIKTKIHKEWLSKQIVIIFINLFVVFLSCIYFYYHTTLENRVNTPLDAPLILTPPPLERNRYWGSYRGGSYFGLKTQEPKSPVVGLMWFAQQIIDNNIQLRHSCNQWDNLKKYGWTKHDGVNFGEQLIEEQDYVLRTSFVKRPGGKNGGDWTARISVDPKPNVTIPYSISLLFYVATDGDGEIKPILENGNLQGIHGKSSMLGNFRLHFHKVRDSGLYHYNYLYTSTPPGLTHHREFVLKNLGLVKKDSIQLLGLKGHSLPNKDDLANFAVHQVTLIPPFEFEAVFESESFATRPNKLAGPIYSKELGEHQNLFSKTFDKVFQLESKGYTREEIKIAQAIFSNALGGVSYFHGSSLVQSQYNKDPVDYWEAPLLTGVPSRSFFPRGFIWDEGFHNLLFNRWDSELSKTILAHWFNLINAEGWIPREQILGLEARERVPKEFIVQRNTNANPPTFFLTLESLLNRMHKGEIKIDKEYLRMIFPRVNAWFNWFNTTQLGNLPGTYRWRGRDENAKAELNPKTLASGLDDYPRASHPSQDERHVDLRCWLAHAASVMSRIAQEIDQPWEEFEEMHLYLTDNNLLEKLHWSSKSNSFSDYGLHTDSVKLARPPPPAKLSPGQAVPKMDKLRATFDEPSLKFVDQFGYVSLFPFLLKILYPENPKLQKVMKDLKDPNLLWTNYGLRSLSKQSPMYMKYNTEHDPPYWRGNIWINMNYMAIQALYHYSELPGPYQEEATTLYRELRKNVVSNILREYRRTGYVWENYEDKTGRGHGSHPFTGWSSLVVLLMAELF